MNEALTVIESLKSQLELQREEVKTLKIKHSSKTQVFAQQSEVSPIVIIVIISHY